MTEQLGPKIRQLVESLMLGAIIRSPRFDDYEIIGFGDSVDLEGVDQQIGEILNENEKAKNPRKSKKLTPEEVKEKEDKIRKKIEKKENDAFKKDIREVQGAISTPQANIEQAVFDVISKNPLGRTVVAMIPIVGTVLATPQIAKKLFELLVAPGSPFDKRFKLILANQEEQFLSREAQKRRALGLDQVVISQTGFGNANGRLTVNTLNQVKQTGVSDIGLNEAAIGMR